MNNAERDLENFLMENPKLIPFQRRLEREMIGLDSTGRMAVISRYIFDNMDELKIELKLLQLSLIDLKQSVDEL